MKFQLQYAISRTALRVFLTLKIRYTYFIAEVSLDRLKCNTQIGIYRQIPENYRNTRNTPEIKKAAD